MDARRAAIDKPSAAVQKKANQHTGKKKSGYAMCRISYYCLV